MRGGGSAAVTTRSYCVFATPAKLPTTPGIPEGALHCLACMPEIRRVVCRPLGLFSGHTADATSTMNPTLEPPFSKVHTGLSG